MKTYRHLSVCLWSAAVLLTACLHAAPPRHERMEYTLRWRGMTVGEAEMESREDEEGLRQVFQVRGTGLMGRLRPVDYRVESHRIGEETVVTKSIRDGEYRQEDELRLSSGVATWREGGSSTAEYEVPSEATDYVSMLINLRGERPLEPGQSRRVLLALDGGLHEVEILAVSRGKVNVDGVAVPATLHEIRTTSGKIFTRNSPRALWIADHAPVILRMDIRTRHGDVRAVLRSWQRDGRRLSPLLLAENDIYER